MIEIPEAATIATQLNASVRGKRIAKVIAAQSPHKFAWFHGDPHAYDGLLRGKKIGEATSFGGFIELEAENMRLLLGEGVALRLHIKPAERPVKHQLLVIFDDEAALSCSIQMYGGMWAYRAGEFDNKYLTLAKQAPSPLGDDFNHDYFERLVGAAEVQKLSAKALLATEQRIPGLGNGVLQDILYTAGIHPKRKVSTLDAKAKSGLLKAIKSVLAKMRRGGGRDTEKDLFGQPGGYRTLLSKNTAGKPCPACGAMILKENYLGGAIYFCPGCQKLDH